MSADDGLRFLADEANRLATTLPVSVVEALAKTLGEMKDMGGPLDRAKAVSGIAHPHYRSLAVTFLNEWQAKAAGEPVQAVASALMTAAVAEKGHREGQTVEPVWTGPDVGVVPFRRTEQALLQVIDSATRRLLVVSYAVYNIPRIGEALIRAADRGVPINIVVESPDRSEGQKAYSTLAALGSSVAGRCNVYLWPIEKRFRDDTGRPGILHVKCAVGDGRWLFLSSANLTEYAFTLNMELGLLITGGHLPDQIESHFDQMIETGVLVKA